MAAPPNAVVAAAAADGERRARLSPRPHGCHDHRADTKRLTLPRTQMLVVGAVALVIFSDVRKVRQNINRNLPQLKGMFKDAKGAVEDQAKKVGKEAKDAAKKD